MKWKKTKKEVSPGRGGSRDTNPVAVKIWKGQLPEGNQRRRQYFTVTAQRHIRLCKHDNFFIISMVQHFVQDPIHLVPLFLWTPERESLKQHSTFSLVYSASFPYYVPAGTYDLWGSLSKTSDKASPLSIITHIYSWTYTRPGHHRDCTTMVNNLPTEEARWEALWRVWKWDEDKVLQPAPRLQRGHGRFNKRGAQWLE